jgi:diguanylate cyclase (GGDEF)-like protein
MLSAGAQFCYDGSHKTYYKKTGDMGVKKQAKPSPHGTVAQEDYSFAVNLMQHLVVPTFVLDAQGKVLIWNKACERLTGMPASEVLGTAEHWRGFYDTPRPCLSDLLVQNRVDEIAALYVAYDDPTGQAFGIHAENWCVMPRLGTQLYLAIDAGPIYDASGKLLAVVETLRDISAQKKAQTELERLAAADGLTGIANRRSFEDKLQREWSRASRDDLPLTLVMIDVDHFKLFNDKYGHHSGDDCLRRIAGVLQQAVYRPFDMVARYGGEEFSVILPVIDMEGAVTVAERIRDGLARLAIPHSDSELGRVSLSIGIASAIPRQGVDPHALVELADRALYEAKHSGRNRIVTRQAELKAA